LEKKSFQRFTTNRGLMVPDRDARLPLEAVRNLSSMLGCTGNHPQAVSFIVKYDHFPRYVVKPIVINIYIYYYILLVGPHYLYIYRLYVVYTLCDIFQHTYPSKDGIIALEMVVTAAVCCFT